MTRHTFWPLLLAPFFTTIVLASSTNKLQLHRLQAIKQDSSPHYIRIDPPHCGDACTNLDEFWNTVGQKYPNHVWVLDCHHQPMACKELGAGFNTGYDGGSLIEAWNGVGFSRYDGKKDLANLNAWLRSVADGTLAKEMATALSQKQDVPERDLSQLPTLPVSDLQMKNDALQDKLLSEGVIHLPKVFNRKAPVAAECQQFVLNAFDQAVTKVNTGQVAEETVFGEVLESKHRTKLKLSFDIGTKCRTSILALIEKLRPLLGPMLGGDAAPLNDWSAIVSGKGSVEQPLHPDQLWTEELNTVNVYIPLDEASVVVFEPRSNSQIVHDNNNNNNNNKKNHGIEVMLGQHHAVRLERGDVVVFDARVWHGQTAGQKKRVMLKLGFGASGGGRSGKERGGPGMLLYEVFKERFTLSNMVQRMSEGSYSKDEL